MQGSQVSSPRNPRAQQLTVLDINLALGKVELAGDALLDEEVMSMFDLDKECDLELDDLWWYETEARDREELLDSLKRELEPEPEREPVRDPWDFWED